MAHEFPHVAQRLSDIDPLLALSVPPFKDEGEHRMKPLRAVMRASGLADPANTGQYLCKNAVTAGSMLNSLMSSTLVEAVPKPKLCVVRQQYKRLSSSDLSTLSPVERASCIPISFSEDLALPRAEPWSNLPVLVVEFSYGTGNQRRYAIMIARRAAVILDDEDDDESGGASGKRIEFTFHSCDKPSVVSKVTSGVPADVLLDRLFGDLPEAAVEEARLTEKLEALSIGDSQGRATRRWVLPRELGQVMATILQNHLRLHVLLNAGAPLTNSNTLLPILIASPTCSTAFADTPNQRFEISMWVHKTSAVCCCSAHGLKPDTDSQAFSGVVINVSVCGHKLCPRTGRCPIHAGIDPPQADPILGQYCVFRPQISVACCHDNTNFHSKQTMKSVLDIPEHILPTLLMVATASMLVTHRPLNRAAVYKSMQEALEEADVHLKQLKPGVSAQFDVEAIRAIRAGMVLRGPPRNGRSTVKIAQRGGQIPNVVKRLGRYSSLFRPSSSRSKKRRAAF